MTKSRSPEVVARAMDATDARIRFDKWLWAARFYKTRSLAAQAIDAGQARIDGERVKPAHVVRERQQVTVRKAGVVWTLDVTALSDRRGSATDAAELYTETPESRAARDEMALQRRAAAATQPLLPGRPTKRQRRKLEDFLNEP
jgi:ribosome-associated heat shock protein Hsp15